MRGVERGRSLREQRERALRREAVLRQPLQVGPAHELHRDEQRVLAFARLVDGDDARVLERRLQHRLAAKARAELAVAAEVPCEHLQRDGAVERELRRLVHRPHAAAAELALDAVAGDRGPVADHVYPEQDTGAKPPGARHAWSMRTPCGRPVTTMRAY